MKKPFGLDILNELFALKEAQPGDGSATASAPEVLIAFGGRVMLVNYSGELSLGSLDGFKPSLFATLTGGAQQIVISLESVTQISRSTLGALVDFASTVLGRGKNMYLFKPPAALEQSLAELQIASFFTILHTEEELVDILPDE